MNIRFLGVSARLLLSISLVVVELGQLAYGQEKQKEKEKDKEQVKEMNGIKSLFDGIPADLRAKVRDNSVRCDRVNDWLKENVNGKGKVMEIRLGVIDIRTTRSPKDGTYLVRLSLERARANALEDKWEVDVSDLVAEKRLAERFQERGKYNFSFEGLDTAEAEKLLDLKHVVIQGKVREAKLAQPLERNIIVFEGSMSVALEDVRVNGKKWRPYISPVKGKGQQKP